MPREIRFNALAINGIFLVDVPGNIRRLQRRTGSGAAPCDAVQLNGSLLLVPTLAATPMLRGDNLARA
jgi:hypothetical protein